MDINVISHKKSKLFKGIRVIYGFGWNDKNKKLVGPIEIFSHNISFLSSILF